ncbi:hypothetical protein DEJ48_35980 [Streptomyces venezuelae]|uniref:STAS domain-containing protein n=1 Tax=Streptomyces venezuelae TaxID=54571 RepID=A0A5P2CBK7_STRVZ|nr:STAS domain-containing protein [Streptomyces venezuelae]QES38099.1 hypothetical protein DEJ48_35980 [Streptomyces venezuelae]
MSGASRCLSPSDAAFLRLELSGELDVTNIAKLCDITVLAIEKDHRRLLLDLAAITTCDNGSPYTLLGISHAAGRAGGSLTVTAASEPVRDALHRTGADSLLAAPPF